MLAARIGNGRSAMQKVLVAGFGGALALALGAAPVAAADARTIPWTLEFRPTAVPATYRTTSAEVTQTVSPSGTKQRRVSAARTVLQTVREVVDGLEVGLSTVGATVDIDGIRVTADEPGVATTFGVRVTGEPSVGSNAPAGGLGLWFPDRPLVLGETWTGEVEGNPEAPVPVRTTYRLARLEVLGARRCLVIETVAEGTGKLGSGTAITYRSKGRVHFDPQSGQVIQARSIARTRFDVPAGHASGVRRHETVLRSSLDLMAPAMQ